MPALLLPQRRHPVGGSWVVQRRPVQEPRQPVRCHTTSLDDLPNELLMDIATYLPLSALVCVRSLNRRWRGVVSASTAAGLPDTTSKLLDVWLAWTALSADSRLGETGSNPLKSGAFAPGSLCTTFPEALKVTDCARYVSLVGRYATAYQTVSHEEPGLSDEFLEWLYEWPERATLPIVSPTNSSPLNTTQVQSAPVTGLLSPSSVINALTRSASYVVHPRINFGSYSAQPSYYYQDHVIFLMALEDGDILLPRVALTQVNVPVSTGPSTGSIASVKARRRNIIKCSSLTGGTGSFVEGDWARFLPISTVRRMSETSPYDAYITEDEDESDGEPKTPVPLYVLSGHGLGHALAGSVCMLMDGAELKILANSWSEYLMYLVQTKKETMQILEKRRLAAMRSKKQVQEAETAAKKATLKKSTGHTVRFAPIGDDGNTVQAQTQPQPDQPQVPQTQHHQPQVPQPQPHLPQAQATIASSGQVAAAVPTVVRWSSQVARTVDNAAHPTRRAPGANVIAAINKYEETTRWAYRVYTYTLVLASGTFCLALVALWMAIPPHGVIRDARAFAR